MSETKSRLQRWLASRGIAIGAPVLNARIRPPRPISLSHIVGTTNDLTSLVGCVN